MDKLTINNTVKIDDALLLIARYLGVSWAALDLARVVEALAWLDTTRMDND